MTYIQASLNNGRISRGDKSDFPLPIFIEKYICGTDKDNEYKYSDMVIRALREWEARTNGLVRFQVINNLYDSKVNLSWARIDGESLGLCTCTSAHGRIFSAEIKIDLSDDIIHRQDMNDEEIYHTILHELGCAIGLGHSNDKTDIMYIPHQYGIINISDNDIHTLEYIYNLPIGLNGKQFGEQLKIDSENFDEIVDILEKRYSTKG